MSRFIAVCGAILLAGGLLGVPTVFAQTSTSRAATAKPTPAGKAEKIDLNTATQQQLEALPGIGPASAKKIIADRPYASVKDLSKAGVSAKTVDKIAPLGTAGAPPSEGMVWMNTSWFSPRTGMGYFAWLRARRRPAAPSDSF